MTVYPRIQTLVIFVICILAVFGVAFYVHGNFWASDEGTPKESLALQVAPSSQSSIDVNYDWKKQFIAAQTGSDAFVAPKTEAQKTVVEENLSPTESLARNFLIRYAELKNVGLEEDPVSIDSLMQQVVIDSSKDMKPPKGYGPKDILIAKDTSALLKNYELTIESVYNDYDSQDYEGEIVVDAFESGDMSRLKKLDPIISEYKKMISKLLNTPVPETLAGYHLDFLNGLSLALYSTEAFRHIDVEPFLAFSSIRLNALSISSIASAMEGIQQLYGN